MLLLHIDSENDAHIIDKHIQDGKQMFIIVYMVGCGPCNATRPEWAKMGNALSERYGNESNLVIADVNNFADCVLSKSNSDYCIYNIINMCNQIIATAIFCNKCS